MCVAVGVQPCEQRVEAELELHVQIGGATVLKPPAVMLDRGQLMTIGQLAAQTGLRIKAIRELEGRGLIYSAGRSEGNYRLFDAEALWCCEMIGNLRALGLTLNEIEELHGAYLDRPDEPVGPMLAALLDGAEKRINERIAELQEIRERIRRFRAQRPDVLAGEAEHELAGADPRRRT